MTWDSSKPVTSGARTSADMRANFQAIEQSLWMVNLLADPTTLIWAGGDTVAPTHYSLGGAVSPAILRCGAGTSDGTQKIGPFCYRLTGGAGQGYLQQN